MVAALGGKESAYMRMSPLEGLGDFRTLAGSGRLTSPAFSSYTQGGMLGRLNSPAGISLRSLASSTLSQQSHVQNISNPIGTLGKIAVSPVSQNPSLFQGVPSSLELDQLQQNKCMTRVGDFKPLDDSRVFNAANGFADTRSTLINNSTLTGDPSGGPMNVLQVNSQQGNAAGFLDQSSVNLSSFNSEPLNIDVGGTSNFLDPARCNENWQSAVQLSKFHPNCLPTTESFGQGQFSSVQDNNSSAGPHQNPLRFTSPLEDSRGGMRCQESMVGQQNISQAPQQRWAETRQIYSDNSNNMLNTMNSPHVSVTGAGNPLMHSMGENGAGDGRMDICLTGPSTAGGSAFMQHAEIEKPNTGSRTRSNGDYMMEQTKTRGGGLVAQGYDLDDFMNSMIKRVWFLVFPHMSVSFIYILSSLLFKDPKRDL